MNWRKWIPFAILFRPDPPLDDEIKKQLLAMEDQRLWHLSKAAQLDGQLVRLQNWMNNRKPQS